MNTKHTPGPWYVGALDRHDQRIVRQQHIEICTCWHHSVEALEKEMEANARLIAAAPDLLKALRAVEKARITDAEGDWLRATELTSAAIAKAEGRA